MEIKFAFFGTSPVAVYVLDELKKADLLPSLIITTPDKPAGRNLVMTSSPTKVWAKENGIKTLQPEKLDESFVNELKNSKYDVFVVASYGKIIPENVLNIPVHGALNVHPSLLPKFRGPSPIISAILEDDKNTGVTIMLMDSEMDHGPILAQELVSFEEWQSLGDTEEKLSRAGGKLLASVIPRWINKEISPQEQEHEAATYCRKFTKEDAFINLEDDYLNYRKIIAFERMKPYFFKEGKRIVINKVEFKDGKLNILRVTPEGKKEMNYA